MRSLLILLLVLISFTTFADNQMSADDNRVDSMETRLKEVSNGEKLDLLLGLCQFLVEKNSEKCMYYGQQALELSRKLKQPQKEVQALIYLGRENSNLGNYFEGLQKFKKAQEIAVDENLGKELVDSWNEIGITYFNIGRYDEALNYYFKTLKKAEEINYPEKIIGTQNNIAIIYSIYKDHDKALEWFNHLVEIYSKQNEDLLLAKTLVNIAIIYDEIGEYDKGLNYLDKAIPVLNKYDEKQMLSSTLNSQGNLFLKQHRYEQAYQNYILSLEIAEAIKFERGVVSASFNLGEYFASIKDYKEAMEFYEKALKLALKNQDKEHIKDCYEGLAKMYALMGNYAKALENTELFIVYKDEIYNDRTQKQISELQIQYETEEKEKEIQFLQTSMKNQRRNLIILIAGLAIISLLILRILHLKQVGLKRKNLLLEQEKQMDKLALEKMDAEKREKDLENLRLQEEFQAKEEINRLKQLKYKTEIKHKERELAANALHMVSKNETLEGLKKSVASVLKADDSEVRSALRQLIQGIDSNINLDNDWEKFKMHFEEVHQDFFKRLVEEYPDLNTGELRFCSYLRLNLDAKEIARILNLSVNAIEKRRYRLRKKLSLNPEDSVFEFLSKY